jgi:peptide/nickel transport system substrate-binding protein
MLTRRALTLATASLPFTSLSRAEAATPKDTIVIASQIDDLITFDPGEEYEISAQIIVSNIYDRLVRYEAEDLNKLVGGVAESWTVSPDAKKFTFKLRPNQKFESGSPVTADDMAFSLQRVVLLNKTPAFLFTQLGWTKDNVKSLILAEDAETLSFTITQNLSPSLVLNIMATVAASVVEKKVAMAHEVNGDLGNTWLKTHSATSGPYRLVSWRANEAVSLEAQPGYHLGPPRARRVIIRHIPEPGTQRLLLEKGDIDIALSLLPDQLAPLASNKEVKIESFPYSGSLYMGLNVSDERLKNPKVRLALKYLVDYQGMVDTFLKGRCTVNQAFLPIGIFSAIKYNPYKLDVGKAKALLQEAGLADGFELRLDVASTSPLIDIAQSVQQTMGQAGIKVNIVSADAKQVFGVYRARKHQMVLITWTPDYLDPHSNADTFAHNDDDSDNAQSHTLAWRNHWYIPEITSEMRAAAQEVDVSKRQARYEALEKKVTDESAFILLFQPENQVASRVNVKGYHPGIIEDVYFFRTIEKT